MMMMMMIMRFLGFFYVYGVFLKFVMKFEECGVFFCVVNLFGSFVLNFLFVIEVMVVIFFVNFELGFLSW